MTATAVSDISIDGDAEAAPAQRRTLSLPAGTPRPRQQLSAEVVIFEEASTALPKPHVTTDAQAEEARASRAHAQERERLSRERAAKVLRQWRSGDPGADGHGMLARPHKDIPLSMLDPEVLEASLARQFADAHLIDRMWDHGQLNDWQFATANRLLHLFDDAGLLASKVAMLGRVGEGHMEISDGMAKARTTLNRLLRGIGHPGDELLVSLCQEQLSIRGQASRAEALKEGLRYLAYTWGINIQ